MSQNRSEHQQRVDELMRKAGQDLPEKPMVPDEKVRWLRAKLILEEAFETITALGFKLRNAERDEPQRNMIVGGVNLFFLPVEPNLVEIVDGCADTIAVTTGTLSACGVPDVPVMLEVDNNNLAKFGPGGYRREDGKWCKPPNHTPPRIQELLDGMK